MENNQYIRAGQDLITMRNQILPRNLNAFEFVTCDDVGIKNKRFMMTIPQSGRLLGLGSDRLLGPIATRGDVFAGYSIPLISKIKPTTFYGKFILLAGGIIPGDNTPTWFQVDSIGSVANGLIGVKQFSSMIDTFEQDPIRFEGQISNNKILFTPEISDDSLLGDELLKSAITVEFDEHHMTINQNFHSIE